ncbi:MAG: PAS domain-containing sensor histidine kinase [Pseudomonadota bacterium]|nr:PAS domain-containing sensor histidine kinase [Pseudomonadota bacterium]
MTEGEQRAREARDSIDNEAQDRLRSSEERFRAFVTATSDVVYSMSPDWREMRYLVGKDFIADTTDASGTWLDRYILPEDQSRVLATIEAAIRNDAVFELEHRVIRADGTVGWTFSRAVPIMNSRGDVTEWFGAARDITERKQREAALIEADQRKDEFMAMLAHELRNPLAPMVNALSLLRVANKDDSFLEKARAILERQVNALTRLVDDLLDMARVTSGRLDLRNERIELGTVVSQALEAARPLMESRAHSVSVTLSERIELDADPNRLQQILLNLLNNAAKYTNPRGRIEVSAWLERQHAVLSVKDTGIGIEPELMAKLFQPFTQGKRSLARSQGGLGLGLSITRRLVEMHAGTIEVRSTVGRGSEFTVRIPLRAPTQDALGI